MSYMRAGYPLRYVKKDASTDYVFPRITKDEEGNERISIEDYGRLSDAGIVELFGMHWETEDKLFKKYLLEKLAQRLDVELREEAFQDESKD